MPLHRQAEPTPCRHYGSKPQFSKEKEGRNPIISTASSYLNQLLFRRCPVSSLTAPYRGRPAVSAGRLLAPYRLRPRAQEHSGSTATQRGEAALRPLGGSDTHLPLATRGRGEPGSSEPQPPSCLTHQPSRRTAREEGQTSPPRRAQTQHNGSGEGEVMRMRSPSRRSTHAYVNTVYLLSKGGLCFEHMRPHPAVAPRPPPGLGGRGAWRGFLQPGPGRRPAAAAVAPAEPPSPSSGRGCGQS